MEVKEPDLSGSYTYADYLTWTWDEMVELIEGKIYKMSPAPGTVHQRISAELTRQFANHLLGKSCQVFVAPFDVRLPRKNYGSTDQEIITVVQPDLCVICDPKKIDERGCLGAPDLVIEILSPATSKKDLREKFDAYEEAGVKEYWIIHPTEQTMLVFMLENGKYKGVTKPYVKGDQLSSFVLPQLNIDLNLIFK